jgi:hypothetical protein
MRSAIFPPTPSLPQSASAGNVGRALSEGRALDAPANPFHSAAMTDKPKPQPQLSEHGKVEAARRQERLAAALRDNLRKRKQQSQARDGKTATKENT